jgi:hypothetical protein
MAVWKALSELFLDTDPALVEDGIVRALADSPYDLDELEAILLGEVYPACRRNLTVVAGVWDGFSEAWLREHIRPLSWLARLHTATFGRSWVGRSPEWRRVRDRLAALRQCAAGCG